MAEIIEADDQNEQVYSENKHEVDFYGFKIDINEDKTRK